MTNPMDELNRRVSQIPRPAVPDPERIAAFAEQRFADESADGHVTATVRGDGRLVGLDVLVSATRGDNRETLGADVVAAVTAAQAAQATAQAALIGSVPNPAAEIGKRVEAFESRMDELMARLDRIGAPTPPPPSS